MTARTIGTLCAAVFAMSSDAETVAVLCAAIGDIERGRALPALRGLMAAEWHAATAGLDTDVYARAIEEIAVWVVGRATSLLTCVDVRETVGARAGDGRLGWALQQREAALVSVAA